MNASVDERPAYQSGKWTDFFRPGASKTAGMAANTAAEREHDAIELALRVGLIALLIYWTSIIVVPFAPIIAWSVIMAVALYPAFEWLASAFGGKRRLAAATITFLSFLLVVGPVTWLGVDLIDASTGIIDKANSGKLDIPAPIESVKDWPVIGPQLHSLASTHARNALTPLLPQLRPVGEKLIEAVGSAGVGTLKFLLSVLVTGVLFLYAHTLVSVAENLAARIDKANGARFVELAGATIRAVSRGVIGVSLLQAIVAGVGMSLAGVPGASILTLLVLILCIVQIGPSVIGLPVAIWAWASLPILPALVVTICFVSAALIDVLVKPFFLSHGLTTPTVVTFIGVIGGVLAHGVIGLFVGPIVVAVAWNVANAWLHNRQAVGG